MLNSCPALPEQIQGSPTATSVTTARIRRLAGLLEETYRQRGAIAATKVLTKVVVKKLPILSRQIVSLPRVRIVRRQIHRRREALGGAGPHLGVAVTGGVGDCIVIARFMRDLLRQTGGGSFDVFSSTPRRNAWIFGSVEGFCGSYHDVLFEPLRWNYGLALRANQTVSVCPDTLDWRALRGFPSMAEAAKNIIKSRAGTEAMIQNHPLLDNFLAQTAVSRGHRRHDFLQAMAQLPYGGDRLSIPSSAGAMSRLGLGGRSYVTVHNGFDTEFIISGRRATKCYPYFGEVVALLKKELPGLTFVQLGVKETSEVLPHCDVKLVGRTSLSEVAALLAGAAFHIDNESGLVHLARYFGTPSAVVFGPTSSAYFGYPDNLAIDPPTCGNCWWLSRTWMDQCPKGFLEPVCMTEQRPEHMAESVVQWWADRKRLLAA